MDKTVIEDTGIPFFGIPAGKLRRYFSLQNCADAFKVGAGFFAAGKILKQEKPDLLFSKGGFVSVPPCAAAASLGIPVFTHESDFSPGLATKINLRFASTVFLAYEETAAYIDGVHKHKIVVSGNPVRAEFRSAEERKGRVFLDISENERILLVLGASQGARQINDLIRETIRELTKYYTVVHQVGPQIEWDMKATEKYRPYPFFKEEMPHVLAAAELVVGRSGAGTIWECAAVGRPMVLIPLSGSGTRGDQVENARFFERAGAAVVIAGGEANPENLIRAVVSLAESPERRSQLAAAATRLGARDGAEIIAQTIIDSICANGVKTTL
jgi:UDP-N-acetylglucosamine--N-acetylmuramyl-(pentapeptide) pyrophosphoryl-undecaprenol N-acetylglucosamine transferase